MKRVFKLILVMTVISTFLTGTFVSAKVNNVLEVIYYPNGDWLYEKVEVLVPADNSFVVALNKLVSGSEMPDGCYNEFPKDTRVLSYNIDNLNNFKVIIDKKTVKKVDEWNYSFSIMLEILSKTIYEKFPSVETVSLEAAGINYATNNRDNFMPTENNDEQVDALTSTIESVILV
jgi:hypothetical protein